jgi:HAD superfamily hydrolase (TIGR01490 family)
MLEGMSTPVSDAGPAERAPASAPVIAFFDVDNTLLRGASVYHLGRTAWKRGHLGWRDLTRFAWQQARFTSVGENHQHQLAVRDRALELIAGHSVAELDEIAEETYDSSLADLMHEQVVARAHDHIAQGHEVWLITATPHACARVIAERLGLTGAMGTHIESVDGIFTGALVGSVMHGPHKAEAAARLAAEKGAELADCWAYSDSRNDIPLLELVGHQQVVNPDAALARYAGARGWPVMRDRPRSSRRRRRDASSNPAP